MDEKQKEQTFVENMFGTVTDKRVIYFREKGWFSGGSREDVPLKHVTSVRIDRTRSIIWGIILVLIGLTTLIFVVGVVPLVFGILLLWGSPTVIVNTAGGDLSAAKGWPWQMNAAEEFVKALRNQLFKE
jgi:hypothetical protein